MGMADLIVAPFVSYGPVLVSEMLTLTFDTDSTLVFYVMSVDSFELVIPMLTIKQIFFLYPDSLTDFSHDLEQHEMSLKGCLVGTVG